MPKLPSFVHILPPDFLREIFLRHGTREEHAAGSQLFRPGSSGPVGRLFLLTKGNCAYLHTDFRGLSRACGILPMGGICGLGPYMARRTFGTSVLCLERVECYALPSGEFARLTRGQSQAQYTAMVEHALRSYHTLYETLHFQISINLTQRLACFLRACALATGARPETSGLVHLPLKLTHERLASFINATRVTATLLLRRLAEHGLVRRNRLGFEVAACFLEERFIMGELEKPQWVNIRSRCHRGAC